MDFKNFIGFMLKVLEKLPPFYLATLFLVIGLLVVLAIKRIFF